MPVLSLSVNVIFPLVILFGGVFFTFRLRIFPLFHPVKFLRELKDKGGGFASLNLALAGTLGVGNIVGVVNAIRLGGAGSVLWMCLCATLCASLKYAEAYLASLTKRKREDGFFGGGYVYVERLLGRIGRIAAVAFSAFFILSSLSTGACMQASAVAYSVSSVFSCSVGAVSLALGVVVLVSVIGGLSKISAITNRIVPVMTAAYLLLSFAVIISRTDALPGVLSDIFFSAFRREGVIFGIGGFCFTECMKCGIMRGLLSNEAGCGSSASAHATESEGDPHRQGCLGIAEVYADTVVMCTVTALAVLSADVDMSEKNDILLTLGIYENVGGKAFLILSALCISVFGYATLICFAGYGGECIRYIFGGKRSERLFYALYLSLYIICIAASPFVSGEAVLLTADISMGVMSLINVPALAIAFGSCGDPWQKVKSRVRA